VVREGERAGALFEPAAAVRQAIVSNERRGGLRVCGVVVHSHGRTSTIHARVVVAADGRRSVLAFGLGLARHPPAPRRWAIGAYAEGVSGMSSLGEMHIRRGYYIGVAPLPNGLTNICLVKPSAGGDGQLRDPTAAILEALSKDQV